MFIPLAHAADAAQPQGSPMSSMIMLVVMVAAFFLIVVRPQMKQAKARQKMIDALNTGDEVVAAGGQLGRVASIDGQYLMLEVAKGVEVQVLRSSVQMVLPQGTLKF